MKIKPYETYLAVDIETVPESYDRLDPYRDKIALVGATKADGTHYAWKVIEGEAPPSWFFQMLKDPAVRIYYHNGAFDSKYIWHNYAVESTNIWDTYLNERLLVAGKGLNCGLDAVAYRRLGVRLDKSIRETFIYGVIEQKHLDYLKKDCIYLPVIAQQQEEEIKQNGQEHASYLENELSWIVGQMEYIGLEFDKDLWESYIPIIRQRRSEAAKVVWDYLKVNYSKDLLTKEYMGGIPLSSRDITLRSLATKNIFLKDYRRATLLKYLYTQKGHEDRRKVIQAIMDFKKWDKALSWDTASLVNPVTGRIHCSFNSMGADTGRFSSNDPNMQNVARPYQGIDLRKLFGAPPGWKYVGADYSQMELRLFGEMSQDPNLIRAYQYGEDVHTQAAEMVLKRKATENDRHYGKIVNFGVRCYGGGPNALIESALDYGTLLTVTEATEFVEEVKRLSPEGELWGKRMLREMQSRGWLQNELGYRRYLEGEDRETVARNTPVQGTAGAISKEAMVIFYHKAKELFGNNVHLVMQVHDELGGLAKDEIAPQVGTVLKESMEEAGNMWMKTIPCVADKPKIKQTWSK